MTYAVTSARSVGDGQPVVVTSGIRRLRGAIRVRDDCVDGSRRVAIRHGGGARVVIGPLEDDPLAIAVVTILESGDLTETFSIRETGRHS